MEVSASGGTPQPLFVGGDNAANPAISSRGNRLAYEQRSQDINIWQIELPTATQPSRAVTRLIASTRVHAGPNFTRWHENRVCFRCPGALRSGERQGGSTWFS